MQVSLLNLSTSVTGFGFSNSITTASNMTVFANNVGIGKSPPAYPLDVTGDINCTGCLRIGGVAQDLGGVAQALSYTFYSITIPTNQAYTSDTQRTLLDYANFPGSAVSINVYTGKQLGSTGIYLLNDGYTIYNSLGSDVMLLLSNPSQYDSALAGAQRILRLYSTRNLGTFNDAIFTKWYHGQPKNVLVPAGARIQTGFSYTDNAVNQNFAIYSGTLKVAMVQTL